MLNSIIIIVTFRYSDLPRWSPNITASLVTELAASQRKTSNWGTMPSTSGGMSIARYFTPSACIICGAATVITGAGPSVAMCSECKTTPQDTVLALNEKIRCYERALDDISKVSLVIVYIALSTLLFNAYNPIVSTTYISIRIFSLSLKLAKA